MGNWSTLEGTIEIPKTAKVSIHKAIAEHLTDEYSLDLQTTTTNATYIHKIELTVCLSAVEVFAQWDEFKKALKTKKILLHLSGIIY